MLNAMKIKSLFYSSTFGTKRPLRKTKGQRDDASLNDTDQTMNAPSSSSEEHLSLNIVSSF